MSVQCLISIEWWLAVLVLTCMFVHTTSQFIAAIHLADCVITVKLHKDAFAFLCNIDNISAPSKKSFQNISTIQLFILIGSLPSCIWSMMMMSVNN